ncbi:DUF6292 family protein [Amycolatopsis sp. VS8301801F10]|uniref:DUF6292 family protein n=1 Tax=unclassified Amycolatopsis TaxID=2618356 RepID=UPI0038FD33B9
MTTTPHLSPSNPQAVLVALYGYLDEVARALGVGPESRTVDQDSPLSAYLALDDRLPGYPGRDVALLWDEVHGWSAAVETHSGEDLIVIRYLGGDSVAPPPARLVRFLTALREDDHRIGQLTPPTLRSVGSPAEIATLLRLRAAA